MKKVVCVGDSITFRNSATLEYPTYVREALGAEYEVTNCGHNGGLLTNQQARAGDYYPTTKEYAACKQAVPAPDIVTVMLGTNDSGYWDAAQTSYRAEYLKLVDAFKQANADVKIVAATSPAAVANWNNLNVIKGAVVRDSIAPLVRTLATEQGFTLADVNAATAGWITSQDLTMFDTSKFADSGVHPNEAGARQIAEVFVAAIQKAAIEPEPTGGAGGMAGSGGAAGGGGAPSAGSGGSAGASSAGAGAGGVSGTGGNASSEGGSSSPIEAGSTAAPLAGTATAGPSATATMLSSDSSCSFTSAAELDPVAACSLLAALLVLRLRRR